MIRKLFVPALLGMIACSPALAASANLRCPDGHTISASTGTNGGDCIPSTGATKGLSCADGDNKGVSSCDGSGYSHGSGSFSARKNAGVKGGVKVNQPPGGTNKANQPPTKQD